MSTPDNENGYRKSEPWKSLWDIARPSAAPDASTARRVFKRGPGTPEEQGTSAGMPKLSAAAQLLGIDVVTHIDSNFRERPERIGISVREAETAKRELVDAGMVKEVHIGKSLYLAPDRMLYQVLGRTCPYHRDRWTVHSFLCLLTKTIIERHPLVQSVHLEHPVDGHGSAADVVVQFVNGNRHAFEIVHECMDNIITSAAKLRNKGFSRVVFICRDLDTANAVRQRLRSSGIDNDYMGTIDCTFFAALTKKNNIKLIRKE